ncbi:hypothetical protein Cgig2_024250 [Carnegiea gigantea]|uniref:Uncharacterized protein n=1 Tax=Carnegiea gigantea TaxID=171969 RepID=A0A9Q1K0D9_9CARY|nr:hypothetical protein Cgig2_024250 [Carnegiea gigantea]
MGRTPCCDKDGVKKGPWTPEEDQKLIDYIQKHGPCNWRTLPKKAGLRRCGKSCRLRWANYLRPDIKRGRFTPEEEDTIIHLHSILGNKWSAIAAKLSGRTDNEIKNYWNTHIRKKLLRMGIDPVTHGPRLDLLDLPSILSSLQNINPSSLLNMPSMLNLQALLNPELLRLATSLTQPSLGNPIMGNNTLMQNQIQPLTQNITPYFDSAKAEPSFEQNPPRNYGVGVNGRVKTEQSFENCFGSNNVTLCPSSTSSNTSAFLSNNSNQSLSNGSNSSFSSVFSTPCSSSIDRLDSSLANLISSACSEDDIETYFGHIVKKFETPTSLDVCSS